MLVVDSKVFETKIGWPGCWVGWGDEILVTYCSQYEQGYPMSSSHYSGYLRRYYSCRVAAVTVALTSSFFFGGLLLFLIIRVRCLDNFFFFQFSLICMVQCFFLRCNALPQQMRWCILVNSCNHYVESLRLLSKFRVPLFMVVLKRWIPCFGTICVRKQ